MTFEKLLSDATKKYHALESKNARLENELIILKNKISKLEEERIALRSQLNRGGIPEDIYHQLDNAWAAHSKQHPEGCYYRLAIVEENGRIHYTLKCSECDDCMRVFK